MKTLKSFLTISFLLLLFTLLFTQSCSDNSIPVNQTVKTEQQVDRSCQTCWLIIYAYFEESPVTKAGVEVSYDGQNYLTGETDNDGYCSFYTEGLGLPGSPPDWHVHVESKNQIVGNDWFPWNGTSYVYLEVECHAQGE